MRASGALALAGVLLLGACASSPPDVAEEGDFETLATDSVAAGWRPIGPVWKYSSDTLFDYFTSGADIYREYGCREVRVQDYANADGDEVRVEVFTTASAAGAYGLFSLKTQPGGEIVDVGVQGWQERFALNFWRGHYQVTLKARRIRGGDVKRLAFLAVAVDQGLEGGAGWPRMMAMLPETDLLPKGRVYVAGPASLKQALGRDPWEFPPPIEGVLGTYAGVRGEYQLLILRYESPRAAREAGRVAAPKGSALNASYTRMLVVVPEPQGSYLFAFVGAKDPEQARQALTALVQEFGRFHR